MTPKPIDTKKLLEQLRAVRGSEPWGIRQRLDEYIAKIEAALERVTETKV